MGVNADYLSTISILSIFYYNTNKRLLTFNYFPLRFYTKRALKE